MPFWIRPMNSAPSTTFSTRPTPPRKLTPAITQAAINSSGIDGADVGLAGLKPRGQQQPGDRGHTATEHVGVNRTSRVLMPESVAALMLPPTA